ncbi:Na-translocating system protein MpsC family protein [cf. Phormidesmis sp. LEGE 11477]|uniref:Na-translocating system protein MpsC family protein n=1 Tax=cf. Phormidesmis sp. LEGE 11477 TaxID=1828680 RepID=UPI00187F359D|nr:Na-translocating system protein MpsC family protein [cf. Phormidesmis sp. LEGE 11477]MBE9059535.1 DUF2294 family protein [cf. Phormidesmis sp. LEGE 11477]
MQDPVSANQDPVSANQDPVSANNDVGQSLERQLLEETLCQLLPASIGSSSAPDEQALSIADELLPIIAAAIEQLYKERLGKPPQQVNCDLLSNRLVVWIEGSITPVERFLFEEGTREAQQLCFTVDALMYRHIAALIERHLNVKVITMIADTCYQQSCTGLIAKLSAPSNKPSSMG